MAEPVQSLTTPKRLTNEELERLCCTKFPIIPRLHDILKMYTKSAMLTQPRDLLQWSAAYFRALARNEVPPVKERFEFPLKAAPSGLTKGLLRVLHKQLGCLKERDFGDLKEKWWGICLDPADAQKLLEENGLQETAFNWIHFVAAASATLGNDGIPEILEIVCFVLTMDVGFRAEPRIPWEDFMEAYTFLADKFKVEKDDVEKACDFMLKKAKAHGNFIGPRTFNNPKCPPLQGPRS